uniref:Ig-like domain-containing protein n=1 Tax=Pseudonaja textilis TaxID=8673 RepID=A0A670ZD62_PSETE
MGFCGIRSQAGQTYTITMSPSVSVQRGFTVYIPCQFTYNQRDLAWNEKVLAYWIKRSPQRYPCSPPLNQNCLPVATNDQNQIVERSAKDRFYLSGDPMKGSCSLVIRNARIEDEGQYYLRIEGKWDLKFSFIQEKTLPFFSTKLASDSELTAQEGDSLEVFCKADSNPPAATSWVKGDSPLQKPLDNQLRLTNLTIADEGAYVCKATNMFGSIQRTFHIPPLTPWLFCSFPDAPKLSRSPQKNTTCSYHENGFLCVCTLHAKPAPQIEWEVDGERITEERRKRENLTVQALVQENEVTSTLKWTGSLDRAHNIICMGNNSYGIQSIQFLLDAKQHPTPESSIGKELH